MSEEVVIRVVLDDSAVTEGARKVERKLGDAAKRAGKKAAQEVTGGAGGGAAASASGGSGAGSASADRGLATDRAALAGAAAFGVNQLGTGLNSIGRLTGNATGMGMFTQNMNTIAGGAGAGFAMGGVPGAAAGAGIAMVTGAFNTWEKLDQIDAKRRSSITEFMSQDEKKARLSVVKASEDGDPIKSVRAMKDLERGMRKKFGAEQDTVKFFEQMGARGNTDVTKDDVSRVLGALTDYRKRTFDSGAKARRFINELNRAGRNGAGNSGS
jgi:hypothetical protein